MKSSRTPSSSTTRRNVSALWSGCIVGTLLAIIMYLSAYMLFTQHQTHNLQQGQDHDQDQSSLSPSSLIAGVLTFMMYGNEIIYGSICVVLASMLIFPKLVTKFVMTITSVVRTWMSTFAHSLCCCFSRRRRDQQHEQDDTNQKLSQVHGHYKPKALFEALVLFECGLLLGSSFVALVVETATMNLVARMMETSATNSAVSPNDGVAANANASVADTFAGMDGGVVVVIPRSLWRFITTNVINIVACWALLYILNHHLPTTTACCYWGSSSSTEDECNDDSTDDVKGLDDDNGWFIETSSSSDSDDLQTCRDVDTDGMTIRLLSSTLSSSSRQKVKSSVTIVPVLV